MPEFTSMVGQFDPLICVPATEMPWTTPKYTHAPTTPSSGYDVQFKVKNLNFTDELLDPSSDAYQKLENFFQNLVSFIFSQLKLIPFSIADMFFGATSSNCPLSETSF
jgi:hypothetical protein